MRGEREREEVNDRSIGSIRNEEGSNFQPVHFMVSGPILSFQCGFTPV